MNTVWQIDISIFALLVLAFLLVYMVRFLAKGVSKNLFIGVIIALMAINLFDAVAWVADGISQPWAYAVNYWGNVIFISLNFLPIIMWLIYLDFKIVGDIRGLKRRGWIYFLPYIYVIASMIANHYTGWVFSIEAGNIYRRGIGIYVNAGIIYIVLIVMFIMSRRYKKVIQGRVLQAIFCFLAIPAVGGILQMLFYGLSILWPSFAAATLMAFILLEKDDLQKDALTKLTTRGQLEHRLQQKLRRKEAFSLVMIDLDGLKIINDTFGHDEGDKALKTAASILLRSVKRVDTVCRYGGDEFMLLIETDDALAGETVRSRIIRSVDEFNAKGVWPYTLDMSFGVVFYPPKPRRTIKEILAAVDHRLYQDKDSRRKTKDETV